MTWTDFRPNVVNRDVLTQDLIVISRTYFSDPNHSYEIIKILCPLISRYENKAVRRKPFRVQSLYGYKKGVYRVSFTESFKPFFKVVNRVSPIFLVKSGRQGLANLFEFFKI